MDERYEARIRMKAMVNEAEYLLNCGNEPKAESGWAMLSECYDIAEKFGFIFQVRRRKNGKISVCFA